MKIKATAVWTCTIVISLLVASCQTQKLKVHWGPQSMMYLKGKYGRRSVSEDDASGQRQALQGWSALLKGPQRLQSLEINKPSHLARPEKIFILFLKDR